MINILIIDDSIHERKRHKLMLFCGEIIYEAFEVENGQEGLDFLKARAHEIDLIILDWNMPVMDGPTFLQEFIKHLEWTHIKIIMSTSFKADEHKQYIRQIYPNLSAYVAKPYQMEEMIQAVKRIINLKA